MMNIEITDLEKGKIPDLIKTLVEGGVNRSEEYFYWCYAENQCGKRKSFLAYFNHEFTGYVHVIYQSKYPYFFENTIPEINDLIVIPKFHRNGIGKTLIDTCESFVKGKYEKIGLGVGLYKDYGQAQRLYFSCGYKPDGNGLMYENKAVPPGTHVFVDDELLIYLCKELE